MTLAYKPQDSSSWVSWNGEVVNDTCYPLNIENLWSDEELVSAGFYKIVYQSVPSDKQATAWTLQDVSGTPTYVPVLADLPVPVYITDRQFFQQLAVQGIITDDEALAAIGPGTLPATLLNLINQLPSDQQFSAKMQAIGTVQFDRTSPLVLTLASLFGWDQTTLNTFWNTASKL